MGSGSIILVHWPPAIIRMTFSVYFHFVNSFCKAFFTISKIMVTNGYFRDDFLCVRQAVNIFIYVVMVKYWYKQINMRFWICGWGTKGRRRYSARSLITRFSFKAPGTCVIMGSQCIATPI